MVQPELSNYIQASRKEGIDDATIKNELRNAGWQEDSISEAFGGPAAPNPVYMVPPRNKRLGLFFIIAPIVGLAIIFAVYAIAAFVVSNLVGSGVAEEGMIGIKTQNNRAVILMMVNVALGFLSILCVLGVLVLTPIGIILLVKKKLVSGVYDERSGKGGNSTIPQEIQGWNWGATGLTFIWGLYHGAWAALWIMILGLIPIVNIGFMIFAGYKGNEWAWRKNNWESPEKFMKSQNKWKIWGILFFALSMLSYLSYIIKFMNIIRAQ